MKKIFWALILVAYVFWVHLAFSLSANPQTYCTAKYGEEYRFVPDGKNSGDCVKNGIKYDYNEIEIANKCETPSSLNLFAWKTKCKID